MVQIKSIDQQKFNLRIVSLKHEGKRNRGRQIKGVKAVSNKYVKVEKEIEINIKQRGHK
jgi:hypothetical protein